MKSILLLVLILLSCSEKNKKASLKGTKGIDVSHFDGEVDFNYVVRDSIDFVYIKSSEGIDFIDPEFRKNWAGAKKAGLPAGVYHFYDPKVDPAEQARFFSGLVKDIVKEMKLAPVLDVEVLGDKSPEELQRDILTCLELIHKELGLKPTLYSFRVFINENLQSKELTNYKLWVAEYEKMDTLIVEPWVNWSVWQYSEKGKVNGIKGDVDLNDMKENMLIKD